MFETLQALSALAQTIETAYRLWELGFSKARNAHKQYIEFGVAIQNLGKNLQQIESVTKNAIDQLQRERLQALDEQELLDVRSLEQILGNYGKTLTDCERLLSDKSKFRHDKNNFVQNIVWNIEIEPEVTRLRERLAFHNVKILMVLKPLEIKLLTDIRALIRDLHEEVMNELKEIKGILVNPKDSTAEDRRLLSGSPSVPQGLADRLHDALVEYRPECQDPEKFSLQLGMDAFLRYFQEDSSSSDTDSYLNLMKCLWIMDRIKQSTEYKQLTDGSLWQRYVARVSFRLAKKCERWEASLVPEPDMETILRLPDDEFRIWKIEEDDDCESDQVADDSVFLTELLNISLPSERGKTTHNLRVLQNVDSTIQIQDTSCTTTGNKEINDVHRFDSYLNKAHLIPIYASPSSTTTALNVKFKSEKDSANGISPSFRKLDDLLKFQEIITGYKAVFYRGDLSVECHSSAKFSLGGSTSKDKGKVQIWQRKRSAQASSNNGGSQSSTMSPTTPSGPGLRLYELPERRFSKMSASPPTQQQFIEKWRRQSTADSLLSSTTFSSAIEGSVSSAFYTNNHVTQFETGFGTVGIRMDKPEKPRLVLFLESKKGGTRSFLSVDVDEDTFINTQTCECRRPQSRCMVSVVEHKKGPLPARRIVSKDGLQSWNLAALGASQPPPQPDPHMLKDLRWIKMQFGSLEDREKFSVRFNEVKLLYQRRLADFWHDQEVVRGQNVVTEMKK